MARFKILATGWFLSMLYLICSVIYLVFQSTGKGVFVGIGVIIAGIAMTGSLFYFGRSFLKRYPTIDHSMLLKFSQIGYVIWLLINLVVVISCVMYLGVWPEFQIGRILILAFIGSVFIITLFGVTAQFKKE